MLRSTRTPVHNRDDNRLFSKVQHFLKKIFGAFNIPHLKWYPRKPPLAEKFRILCENAAGGLAKTPIIH
jgi:hypothetical protein